MPVECAAALAALAVETKRRVTDEPANLILERAASRLGEIMSQRRAPLCQIEAALDLMAEAYRARLDVLDANCVQ
jgi:hypothetical protein